MIHQKPERRVQSSHGRGDSVAEYPNVAVTVGSNMRRPYHTPGIYPSQEAEPALVSLVSLTFQHGVQFVDMASSRDEKVVPVNRYRTRGFTYSKMYTFRAGRAGFLISVPRLHTAIAASCLICPLITTQGYLNSSSSNGVTLPRFIRPISF
jgi:hypothetical protein